MVRLKRDELIEEVLKCANNLFRLMLPTVPQELLAMDYTMPQLKTMFLLFLKGPMRMSDLAADLGVTLATATGLADRLVEKDLVARESEPGDRRVVRCRLSAAGQQSISRIWETSRNRTRTLLKSMKTTDLRALDRALESLLATARLKHRQGEPV
jgi:DNA-binding MarR family transcriptional regulator